MKTKIITDTIFKKFEDKINEFLESLEGEYIDTKFSACEFNESVIVFSALIIYKEK